MNPATKEDSSAPSVVIEMPVLTLKRIEDTGRETFGEFYLGEDFDTRISYSLELPWRENRPNISCIPAGTYICAREPNAVYTEVFRLLRVPGRDGILIHPANMAAELEGCIAPGLEIERVGWTGVLHSRDALSVLRALIDTRAFHLRILPVGAAEPCSA